MIPDKSALRCLPAGRCFASDCTLSVRPVVQSTADNAGASFVAFLSRAGRSRCSSTGSSARQAAARQPFGHFEYALQSTAAATPLPILSHYIHVNPFALHTGPFFWHLVNGLCASSRVSPPHTQRWFGICIRPADFRSPSSFPTAAPPAARNNAQQRHHCKC